MYIVRTYHVYTYTHICVCVQNTPCTAKYKENTKQTPVYNDLDLTNITILSYLFL